MLSAPMQSAHLPQHSPLRSRSVLPSLFRLAAASPQSRQVRIRPLFRKRKFRQSPQRQHPQRQHPLRKKLPTPFIDPTDPPATPVPVVGEYTKPCQKVKVDFPATELSRAFSVTFDLPEGWTVRSDEGVYDNSSSSFDPGYDEYGCALPGRKLLFDENGNLAGAVGFSASSAERYAEYGYSEAFAHFATGHVKYFDWDNYHFVDGDSSNCKSVYSVSYHGISSAAWIDGWGFHPFYCPTAVSCCVTGNPVSVAVELSNTYEDSASLSKRVAESIRFE